MTTNHDALREAFNAFLLEQHERHKHQHNHFHVARNEWARRTQSTQYEALAASKPEPQAQAVEPEVVAIADGTFNCVAPLGMPLITLQSHREAMKQLLEANASYAGRERWWNDRMFELEQRLAKKDAALQACVAHMLIAYGQNSHDMILTGDELRGLHAAITKAEEARK